MSSSARAVFFGRPPGIFLLTKWITCSRSWRPPVVAGGRWSALRPALEEAGCAQALRLVAPLPTISVRISLMVAGPGGVEEEHRRRTAGVELLLAHARSRSRMAIDTSPKSMSTGQGLGALVADGAVVGDVVRKFVPVLDRHAAAGLLLVQEGLDQQRGGEDLVARRVQQVGARHVGGAHGLALAAAQAVLDASEMPLMSLCCMISDSCPSGRSSACRRWRRSPPGSSLPLLKRPSGSTAACTRKGLRSRRRSGTRAW
jgi:hypothetical protein